MPDEEMTKGERLRYFRKRLDKVYHKEAANILRRGGMPHMAPATIANIENNVISITDEDFEKIASIYKQEEAKPSS